MTIEEKLQHFYDVSVEEARQEASRALEEHKKTLQQMLDEHKKTRRMSAELEVKAEAENARREINKALSAEQLTIKRNWTIKQNELKEKLFIEVKDRLEQFMGTQQYEDYLCRKIKEATDFAGKDELYIYISPADSSKLHSLIARTGAPIEISQESFMGGIKAMIPSKNILIDNSFLEIFQSMRKEFKFDGGLNHE
ncbi:MAG: V-type ATP synthase subunit E [Eubacteriales bacterium]|nr:V-type ATP synthase subunit E [Eubacteriales bacterium]